MNAQPHISMIGSALSLVNFVANRNAPRTEPLDANDWSNIDAAQGLLAQIAAQPAAAARPALTSVFSAWTTAQALRELRHRGSLIEGDMDAIYAAVRLLELANREGVL
jgi:hypothetical protein